MERETGIEPVWPAGHMGLDIAYILIEHDMDG